MAQLLPRTPFALMAVALVATRLAAQAAPRVSAGGETLEGVSLSANHAVFRGIPYAAAPVGPLRWRAPAPHQPRAGVQPATAFSAACVQSDRLSLWTKSLAKAIGTLERVKDGPPVTTSEDCLFLNIWTNHLGGGKPAPVMVWIHGGSNLNGEGATPLYDGAALANQGVVVVTINYRLGAFGFFAHPGLTAESPHHASGNYGLLDQLEALRWVQHNIKAFGGDPTRITAFGESAGAMDIVHLMASPLSAGLFQRAIAESGPPMGAVLGREAAETSGALLAKSLNLPEGADQLAALRAQPATAIHQAAERLMLKGQFSPGPIVDGWVVTDFPGRVFEAGKAAPVPLLIGSNALEMTSLRYYLPPVERTTTGYDRWLEQFGPGARRMAELYPAPTAADVEPAVIKVMTDLIFTCPSRFAARAYADHGRKAYLYQFTRVAPGGAALGAFHAMEIGYVFGNRLEWLPADATDDRLATAMTKYWTQFAATGDPNQPGLPAWPAYSSRDPHLELGPEVAVKTGLLKDACDVVDEGIRRQIAGPKTAAGQ